MSVGLSAGKKAQRYLPIMSLHKSPNVSDHGALAD